MFITRKNLLSTICMSCYIDNNLPSLVNDIDKGGEFILTAQNIYEYYSTRAHLVPVEMVVDEDRNPIEYKGKFVLLSECTLIFK